MNSTATKNEYTRILNTLNKLRVRGLQKVGLAANFLHFTQTAESFNDRTFTPGN